MRTGPAASSRLSARSIIMILITVLALGGVVFVLEHRSGGRTGNPDAATSAPSRPFEGTPAAGWHPAAQAIEVPGARASGPYSAHEVARALRRAKAYLIEADTGPSVLNGHHLSAVERQVTHVDATPLALGATELAPNNRLATAPRVKGSLTYGYVPPRGRYADYVAVRANLVWAYALTAGYPTDSATHVVVKHERVVLAFYFRDSMDGPNAKPDPIRIHDTVYDMDCGYQNHGLIGLPRLDDPDRAADGGTEPGDATKYDPTHDQTHDSGGCVR